MRPCCHSFKALLKEATQDITVFDKIDEISEHVGVDVVKEKFRQTL